MQDLMRSMDMLLTKLAMGKLLAPVLLSWQAHQLLIPMAVVNHLGQGYSFMNSLPSERVATVQVGKALPSLPCEHSSHANMQQHRQHMLALPDKTC